MSARAELRPAASGAARPAPFVIVFGNPSGGSQVDALAWLTAWMSAMDLRRVSELDELSAFLRRSRAAALVVDARADLSLGGDACARCKEDPYSALTPCIAIAAADATASDVAWLFRSGADEVVTAATPSVEGAARVEAAVRRARRDLAAQPTSGLPGPPAIEAFLDAKLRTQVPFAACYADLDHFKEYNDRYGFHEGDRVIRMVARMLYDVALGSGGTQSFVGHIGGDDFLCVLPLEVAADACALMVETFDLLAPLQYNAADRRAGYYLGKDRRGQLHRVPLMTLSLGVATTERRRFTSAADVSRLASEMKSFAKTIPGSVFAFDRRGDDESTSAALSSNLE